MTQTAVRAHALHTVLDEAPPGIKCLSLDCFDTLIWRNLHAPQDIFPDLGLPGGSIERRRTAEMQARALAPHFHNRSEVTLEEIHAELAPGSVEMQQQLVQAELASESRHCFAFAPVRDLILAAKERRLKVILVSDTYLSETRLRALIADVAGPELLGHIDHVFCSSEYGVGKTAGLFDHVLRRIRIAPERILHVGDNPVADVLAAQRHKIHAVHLQQFSPETVQRLRLEAAAGTMLDPDARNGLPLYQPHRARIALREKDEPVHAFGHDVLGPIMTGFATWVEEEARAMEEATGKKPRLLFLLRDGYLPARAFAALYPQWADHMAEVSISRLTAAAAGLCDPAWRDREIKPWLAANLHGRIKAMPPILRRALLGAEEEAGIAEDDTLAEFAGRMGGPQPVDALIDRIGSRSRAHAQRLIAHLRGAGVKDGDAVMLVDLGYSGSVQDGIEKLLREEMGLTVAGRYLLLREHACGVSDKKGYFDSRHYDYRALTALWKPISLFEQFCTAAFGSVIDYRADGAPILGESDIKGAQSARRETAQAGCIDFVRAAGKGFVRPPRSDDGDARRHAAAATLARLLYLPMDSEVAMLDDFSHDVQLGQDGLLLQMFDPPAAERGLRRRGLFYTKSAMRTYLPGELQKQGLPINLSLLTMERFGLAFSKSEFDIDAMELPIQLFHGGRSSAQMVGAHRTADGYYRATIPVGKGEFTIGVFLGRLFEYVQFEEISFQPVDALTREDGAPATPLVEGMAEVAPGLYRIDAPEGFMVVPAVPGDRVMLLNLVFRPIVLRAEGEAARESRRAAA